MMMRAAVHRHMGLGSIIKLQHGSEAVMSRKGGTAGCWLLIARSDCPHALRTGQSAGADGVCGFQGLHMAVMKQIVEPFAVQSIGVISIVLRRTRYNRSEEHTSELQS